MILSLEPEFVELNNLIETNWDLVPEEYYYMLGLKNIKSFKK